MVVFLTCGGCCLPRENEGGGQRGGDKGREAGEGAFLTSRSPHPKGCASLSVVTLRPSNQALFCLGCFEVLGNPETSFKYKGYCSGLGEDPGEPAAGQWEWTG